MDCWKKLCITAFVLFFTTVPGVAGPDWMTSTPRADSTYKYYTGRGEASSEKEAFDQAVQDVYDQAARENFPADYSYQADLYQTESESYLTERTIFSGISVRFDGFEKEDEFIQKTENGYSVKLLYRFSKKAIAREKERLKNQGSSPKREMSVVGNKSDAPKGVLIVETIPADGAVVYVDGDRYGQTPMTLYGSLAAGKHALRIDHPRYETVDETIITAPGKTVTLKKTLVPAFTTVSITTDPVNADLFLDGRSIGTAPLIYKKIPVEKETILELRHPEMEKLSIPLNLKKDENKRLNILLPEKTAKISLFSFPQGADVFIDKTFVGKTPLRHYPVARGSHSFALEKNGYEPVIEPFSAKGGENLSKTVDLKTIEKQTTVISKNKTSVVAGNVDKYHRYEEIRPPEKHLSLSSAATGEDILLAIMHWSYPSNFIRARVSYIKREKSGTLFFVFLSFDPDLYQKRFVEPVNRALKNVSSTARCEEKKVDCFYDDKTEGQVVCLPPSMKKVSDTIFVKTGPVRHNFWSDKADFDAFVLMTHADGRREKIKPYEKRKIILSFFDRENKKREIFQDDLYLSKFSTDKNRNVVFMPSFKDGYGSLVLAIHALDVDPLDISRVTVRITEGSAVNDPYPPRKKRMKR